MVERREPHITFATRTEAVWAYLSAAAAFRLAAQLASANRLVLVWAVDWLVEQAYQSVLV